MTASRVKISVSLPRDLVISVDRQARATPSASRSSVIEAWLRQASRRHVEEGLRDEVVAYYTGLDEAGRVEDEALARASSRAARRLVIDEPPRRGHRR